MKLLSITTLALLTMASAAKIPPAEAQKRAQAAVASNTTVPYATLREIWPSLPAITVAKAIGTYRGGLFVKGGEDPINWWGKQIISEIEVNPLLSTPPKNASQVDAQGKQIVFPYPRPTIAQARDVVHDGVVSATIIYNRLPLLDYFRVVKEGDAKTGDGLVLLGRSDLQGKEASPAYFHLTRVSGQKVDSTYKNPYPNTTGF